MGPSSISLSMIGGRKNGFDGEFLEEDTPNGMLFENKMISLESILGRPYLDNLLHADGAHYFESTRLYMIFIIPVHQRSQ